MLEAAVIAGILALFPRGTFLKIIVGLMVFFLVMTWIGHTPDTRTKAPDVESSQLALYLASPDKNGIHPTTVVNNSDHVVSGLVLDCDRPDTGKSKVHLGLKVQPHSSETEDSLWMYEEGTSCELTDWESYQPES